MKTFIRPLEIPHLLFDYANYQISDRSFAEIPDFDISVD